MAVAVRTQYKFPNATEQEPGGWLSASQVTEYLGCPACYELARVRRVPKPVHVSLPLGGGLHKAVEHMRRILVDPRREEKPATHFPEATELAIQHFEQSLTVDPETGGEIIVDLGEYQNLDEVKDHAAKLAKILLPEITEVDKERGLIHSELNVEDLDVPNPWPFLVKGKIDALYGYEENGEEYVTKGEDLKTGKKQATPELSVAIQCAIYDSFVGGIPWVVDVLAKTKTPSFKSYWIGQQGHLTPDEHRRIRALVLDVADRIAAGDFPSRPSWMCKYEHGYPVFRASVTGFAA